MCLRVMRKAAQAGRFPNLRDSDGIWRLLAEMTRRKVVDHVRRNSARPTVGESALKNDSNLGQPLEGLASDNPSPAMIAMVTDQIERMLTVLPEKYHPVALKKLECLTGPEIARECGIHLSTVERRLRIIRGFWARELERLS